MRIDISRKIFYSLFFILGINYLSIRAQSKRFFVSPSGNDLNTGINLAQPLKSINTAINLASAGDTVYLLAGTYNEIVRLTNKNGSPEKYIYLYGYYKSLAMQPVIDGCDSVPSNTASYYWMQIQNSSWIEIGNIVFKNGWTNPIQVVNSSYLTFNGCTFYGGKRVIDASGSSTHHLLVEGCYWDQGGDYLWKLQFDANGIDAWTSMHGGALQYYNGSLINFSGTGGSVVIRNNTIINAFNGIRWTSQKGYDSNVEIYNNSVSYIRDNDFEPEYYTYNVQIYHNRSFNIHKTMSVDHVQGGYIYYFGNIITSDVSDSWASSIATSFWKIYGAEPNNLSYPMYAFNNSFCGCGKAFTNDAGTKAVQLKHFNNAYDFTKSSRNWQLNFWDSTDVFDYDVSNLPWPANITNNNQETHGKFTDPLYMDKNNFNLKLQANSPAIDAGKIMSFPEFGWVQSFQGAAPDIGAYEGDNLVDGPAFRFRTAPELNITYKEKPRIVKFQVVSNILYIYFSAPIDPITISAANINIQENDSSISILNASLLNDNYEMEIETQNLLVDSLLVFNFSQLPKGIDGEDVTFWASAINVRGGKIVSGIKREKQSSSISSQFSLNIYPNPFNNQARILINIPSITENEKNISIQIIDVLGRKIKEMNLTAMKGITEFSLTSDNLASGIYFIILNYDQQFLSRKIVVLK